MGWQVWRRLCGGKRRREFEDGRIVVSFVSAGLSDTGWRALIFFALMYVQVELELGWSGGWGTRRVREPN
jgi:hypothetical protein